MINEMREANYSVGELCDAFAVNRGAVREALKRLEQIRLVSMHQGGRTRARDWREAAGDMVPVVEHVLAGSGDELGFADEPGVDDAFSPVINWLTNSLASSARRARAIVSPCTSVMSVRETRPVKPSLICRVPSQIGG